MQHPLPLQNDSNFDGVVKSPISFVVGFWQALDILYVLSRTCQKTLRLGYRTFYLAIYDRGGFLRVYQ
ncbi:MAG: hypothetical protein Q8R88_00960, partial [Desulfoprunum sp.]|nr:hypothetical protein [Desulfoprunum sp.]